MRRIHFGGARDARWKVAINGGEDRLSQGNPDKLVKVLANPTRQPASGLVDEGLEINLAQAPKVK